VTGAIDISALTVRYAGATALDDVSLTVPHHGLTALIGANGAGKTTLVKALCGLVRPDHGTITVDGRIAHVPEGREMFPDMTVDDNLRLGAWRTRRRDTAPVYDLFPGLAALRTRRAGTLSGGQQQMVAIGRALMAEPDVLVIDELSLGLAPMIVTSLVDHLVTLHTTRNLSVLLIEQNARLALDLCHYAYVLESGRIALHGPAPVLSRDPRVTAAYLGGHVQVTHE
jgi:branched-chain amino acid transport system ATP-binding protein